VLLELYWKMLAVHVRGHFVLRLVLLREEEVVVGEGGDGVRSMRVKQRAQETL
jgi:hypothetical protein